MVRIGLSECMAALAKGDAAVRYLSSRLRRFGRPVGMPANGTPAILALGNRALEIPIIERMVFYFHREPVIAGVDGGAPRHGP